MSTATADPFVEGIDALLAASVPGCALGKWMHTLAPERQGALNRALAVDPKLLSVPKILDHLRGFGFEGSKTVVNEHRSGTCACVR